MIKISPSIKQFLVPFLIPLTIGIGSASITNMVLINKLEERVLGLKEDMKQHEVEINKEFLRYSDWMYKFIDRLEISGKQSVKMEQDILYLKNEVTTMKSFLIERFFMPEKKGIL